jgi:hypothetical protein
MEAAVQPHYPTGADVIQMCRCASPYTYIPPASRIPGVDESHLCCHKYYLSYKIFPPTDAHVFLKGVLKFTLKQPGYEQCS